MKDYENGRGDWQGSKSSSYLDENGQHTSIHDQRLKYVSPHHRLHPSLQIRLQ